MRSKSSGATRLMYLDKSRLELVLSNEASSYMLQMFSKNCSYKNVEGSLIKFASMPSTARNCEAQHVERPCY